MAIVAIIKVIARACHSLKFDTVCTIQRTYEMHIHEVECGSVKVSERVELGTTFVALVTYSQASSPHVLPPIQSK